MPGVLVCPFPPPSPRTALPAVARPPASGPTPPPHAHASLKAALRGQMMINFDVDDAILLVETETLAATFRSVDAALKAVPVALANWRLGRGIAGRGVFALRGEHANLEAAEEVIVDAAGGGLLECQLIPRPDPLGLWAQPFGQGV